MTGTRILKRNESGPTLHPDDFSKQSLPPFVDPDWWNGDSRKVDSGRGYWATLDVELAFPSVRLNNLRAALNEMLTSNAVDREDEASGLRSLFSGYPAHIVELLSRVDVRERIAHSLVEKLLAFRINHVLPRNTWDPGHARAELLDDDGLPTGLAISGLLLNVVLSSVDSSVMSHLETTQANHRGAFLRFADDMILLSRSKEGLFDLIDVVWQGISGDPEATLASRISRSNLYINVSKTGPESVGTVLNEYLKKSGWSNNCPEQGCVQLSPPEDAEGIAAQSLGSWWRTINWSLIENKTLLDKLEREAFHKNELGPFVTTLVERMSDIGRDTLSDRFGTGPRNRLLQLHELVRFEIDDQQVRPDTRRLFAANRLARAWLSGDGETQRSEISEIRTSVAHTLQQAPWKTAIWRPVVRAATRRPDINETDDARKDHDDQVAKSWLITQLGRIAAKRKDSPVDSWITLWPEPPDAAPCPSAGRSDDHWKCLYLSFHRAAFWREIAGLLRMLHAHAERMERDDPWDPGPPPTWWTVRGVPSGSEREVAAWLASFDTWVKVLYPAGNQSDQDLRDCPWELNALIEAVLASTSKIELAKAFWKSGAQGDDLVVPEGLERVRENARLRKLLQDCERLARSRQRGGGLTKPALSHFALGNGAKGLGRFLFRKRGKPCIDNEIVADPGRLSVIANTLGIARHVPRELIETAVFEPGALARQVRADPFGLWEYHHCRRILLGYPLHQFKERPTLHRLLWGDQCSETLDGWRIRAWEAPSVGIPVTVALHLFSKVLKGSTSTSEPHTWGLDDGTRIPLAIGRRLQLGNASTNSDLSGSGNDDVRAERTLDWEVPPHAAYFLPIVSGGSKQGTDPDPMYCDALLLLTACDGDERILDSLIRFGSGSVPFEDRWNWRSRIHLPPEIWTLLEKVIRLRADDPAEELSSELEGFAVHAIEPEDFVDIRVDLSLNEKEDQEIVRTIRRGVEPGDLANPLKVDADSIQKDLVVRIGQISASLVSDQKGFLRTFPKLPASAVTNVMAQVSAALQLPRYGADAGGPEIVILPEVAIPQTEIRTLRDHAAKFERAYLAGLMWRVLPTAAKPAASTTVSRFLLVNEAELAIPIGVGGRGPVTVRSFRVRKPRPAIIELGFAEALRSSRGGSWEMLPGTRWYRFVHERWGDFSVAICSDILDSAPWRSLQGEILHLFMCAFNKDVDLFDGLTWIRAYEGAMNVVSVNHGYFGGSFLWTPKHGHKRELARLRGNDLHVIADVMLPVSDVLGNQIDGLSEAVVADARSWRGKKTESGDFKAPPPSFKRGNGTTK
jgi:hypothetical protein